MSSVIFVKIFKEVFEALRTLGLTEYEARAYVSLVEKGVQTAGDVSEYAEIPHSKTYEILSRIEKRGLIQVQNGRPRVYNALPSKMMLEKLERTLKATLEKEFSEEKATLENAFKQRMAELSEAGRRASDVLGNLWGKGSKLEPSEDIVWRITGVENINQQIDTLLQSGKSEVLLMLPRGSLSLVERQVGAISSRGVNVELLVHNVTESVRRLLPHCKVFCVQQAPPARCGIVLVDGKNAMFISEDYGTGFKTSSKSLVTVLSNFYQHEREEASKVGKS